MVYLFQNTMVSYLDLPVSRHHGILPWYFTIGYLFQNTVVFYHRLPVSKHRCILPWFPCFKTSCYLTMVYLFQNTMVFILVYLFLNTNLFYHGIRWYIFIRLGERPCVDGEEGDRVFIWGTDELGRRLC